MKTGGAVQPMYGGFQNPMYGGFQNPMGGGFYQQNMYQPSNTSSIYNPGNRLFDRMTPGFQSDYRPGLDFYGPVELGNGDNLMVARELIPDEKNQGDVTATFKTRLYPNGTETSHGPFTMANPTSVRFQGRQVSMRIDAAQNSDWRVGTMRLDAVAGGKR